MKNVDIIIIGGGVAGLWTLNRLCQLGFRTILLENNALGAGQTIRSQGIIHGGIKYALKGNLTRSSEAIATMPMVWQNCLEGHGEIDLTQVHVLSPYHYLWSTGKLLAKVNQFLANKVLASHSEAIVKADYPVIFQHPQFKGQVYRVRENVLDVRSLLQALAAPHQEAIVKINKVSVNQEQGTIDSLTITGDRQTTTTLTAKAYIFTAGSSNEALVKNLDEPPPCNAVLCTWSR